jgi:hypothetical protein
MVFGWVGKLRAAGSSALLSRAANRFNSATRKAGTNSSRAAARAASGQLEAQTGDLQGIANRDKKLYEDAKAKCATDVQTAYNTYMASKKAYDKVKDSIFSKIGRVVTRMNLRAANRSKVTELDQAAALAKMKKEGEKLTGAATRAADAQQKADEAAERERAAAAAAVAARAEAARLSKERIEKLTAAAAAAGSAMEAAVPAGNKPKNNTKKNNNKPKNNAPKPNNKPKNNKPKNNAPKPNNASGATKLPVNL